MKTKEMTYHDAELSILAYCVECCEKIDTCRGEDSECVNALAIQALEKQIPSKPNRSGFTGQYTCKKCGDAIFGLREGIDLYCPHCGQKQDWSNE